MGLDAWLLVVVACGLDRLLGDPPSWPHPVVGMGWVILRLRRLAEGWAGDRPGRLRLAGCLITAVLVLGSGLAGWGLEQLLRLALGGLGAQASAAPWLLGPLVLLGLASALAGRSLEQAVGQVLAALPDLATARRQLAWIVGRDTAGLSEPDILRALAETASENAVDGLFAPLFWMLIGAWLWSLAPQAPGPLALAWAFKASSTLDSMLGYRRDRLRWLGTAGARLDDLLVWLPCRLVALSLPLAQGRGARACRLSLQHSLADGAADPSPNAGVSQAAFAWAAGVGLGGANSYGGERRFKPLLAQGQPPADGAAVGRILALSRRLEGIWLVISALVVGLATAMGGGR